MISITRPCDVRHMDSHYTLFGPVADVALRSPLGARYRFVTAVTDPLLGRLYDFPIGSGRMTSEPARETASGEGLLDGRVEVWKF